MAEHWPDAQRSHVATMMPGTLGEPDCAGPVNGAEPRSPMIRILLVDEHTAVREALASAFDSEDDLHVVAQTGSLRDARHMLAEVDVAVVDFGLTNGHTVDLIDDLRQGNPNARALVLTATSDRAEVAEAVRGGAAGVLHKGDTLRAVLDGVRRVAAGETLLASDEVIGLLRFAARRLEREHDDRLAIGRLTSREREVLQTLAEGLDSRASAERLCITVRTQRNHVANIEAKLGVHSQLQAMIFALRYGVVRVRSLGEEPTAEP